MKTKFLVLVCLLMTFSIFGIRIAFLMTSEASEVSILGDFTDFKPEKMDNYNHLWRYMTDLEPGDHLYKFIVDGERRLDFKNAAITVHEGEPFNVRTVPAQSDPQKGDGRFGKVYFGPSRPFMNPVEKGEIYLTIGFDEDDVEDVALQSNAAEVHKEMYTDKSVRYFRFHVKTPATTLKYRFLIKDGKALLYGYNGGEDFVEFDFDHPLIPYLNIPDWARGNIVYQIFPDRFLNGDSENDRDNKPDWYGNHTQQSLMNGFYGGDLQGVIYSTDYLNVYHIDTLYLNPIFQATSTHKYNTTDYLRIDSDFGNEEVLENLITILHDTDKKLILDAVFNHTGTRFFAMQENLNKQKRSRYLDWYYIKEFPIKQSSDSYKTWQGYASLPKLNTDNPEVRGYIARVLGKWFAKGVDGWRLDTADQYPMRFLSGFLFPGITGIDNESVLVGEYWENASDYFNKTCMNSVMNYLFRDAVITYVKGGSSKAFIQEIRDYLNDYPPQIVDGIWNMLGSHDTPRIFTLLNEEVATMKLAAVLHMTFKGSPLIYYGDEIGMTGEGDPFCRKPFPWEKMEQMNMAIASLYRELGALRNANPALKKGAIKFIYNQAGVLGYERVYEDESVLVFLNSRSKTMDVDFQFEDRYVELLSGREFDCLEAIAGKHFQVFVKHH